MKTLMIKKTIGPIVFSALLITISCQKDFLAIKPDKTLLNPTTLEDFDAILDAVSTFNKNFPGITQISSDDFYTVNNAFFTLDLEEQAAYTWDESIFKGSTIVHDWNYQYGKIFHANVVLDGLKGLKAKKDESEFNRIKGSALFHRGFAYYALSQVFMEPFLTEPMGEGEGLLVSLEADINKAGERTSIAETYRQIISDLNEAESLLPATSLYKTRPAKDAVWALLARVYLSIADYDNAKLYAHRYLAGNNGLLDYNSLDTSLDNPFPDVLNSKNEEVIYYSNLILYQFMSSPFVGVDTLLYDSYDDNDLRKNVYFTSNAGNIRSLTGSYTGGTTMFSGLTVSELILIRAECFAREGDVSSALFDLNYLLENRFVEKTYEPLKITNAKQALKIILDERRKELVGRGLRWSDLRRLNNEEEFSRVLTRGINDQVYVLPPQSKRFTLPFPDYEK